VPGSRRTQLRTRIACCRSRAPSRPTSGGPTRTAPTTRETSFAPKAWTDQAQRIGTEELAQLAGLTPEDLPERLPRPRSGDDRTYSERFIEQVTALQGPAVATATLVVLEAWTSMGGTLLYGTGGETSCFLMARGKEHELGNIWPAAIYPSGKVEVVFQHLSVRPPFDDVTLREELRQRLNQLPGVDIAAAKIALRPGFLRRSSRMPTPGRRCSTTSTGSTTGRRHLPRTPWLWCRPRGEHLHDDRLDLGSGRVWREFDPDLTAQGHEVRAVVQPQSGDRLVVLPAELRETLVRRVSRVVQRDG
jgi:hypothetical protein